ncbi:hypothetical protein [Synechocystis sp. CACIAM 05]|uniref:hypothetical protein n=1 Tax=Synechocystis sp. CACIAM 05 TaxID=1933929 RepID=UPI001F1FBE40|nr:hypothetical protein [Synechocystis sp. CACIAM 05]
MGGIFALWTLLPPAIAMGRGSFFPLLPSMDSVSPVYLSAVPQVYVAEYLQRFHQKPRADYGVHHRDHPPRGDRLTPPAPGQTARHGPQTGAGNH